jgi:D-alanine-D-alanine ligase
MDETNRFDARSEGARRPRVLVLMGGPDAEREVSLMSGAEVARALRAEGSFEVVDAVVDRPDASELLSHRPDAIYPVLHGPWGEGGPLQEILEAIERDRGIPFIGPGSRAAATAMDKLATKALARAVGVRTAAAEPVVAGRPLAIQAPLVLKPSNDGSSVDLRICRSAAEIEAARRELEPKRDRLMAEAFVAGRELTMGVVGDGTSAPTVLPIIEIVPAVEFYDYEAKYIRDDTRYAIDPALPTGVAEELRRATAAVFLGLGLRDVARADFILGPDGPSFLEINTAPGMTTHSLVPKASRHRGVDMPELCAGLVRSALSRVSRPTLPKNATAAGAR